MEKELAYLTSLIGDPIRTNILWTLLDGRAYTATELAICSETSPQNISMHLHKLVAAEMLAVESQGRHKYYRFSRPEVAYAIEAIGSLLPEEKLKKIAGKQGDSAIKYCRTCYDHLAGKIGVSITEALVGQKIIEQNLNAYNITEQGQHFFSELEIDIENLKGLRRAFAKCCLDWSERKHHLAGALGAELFNKLLALDYVRRTKNSRVVVLTSKGRLQLYDKLKISL